MITAKKISDWSDKELIGAYLREQNQMYFGQLYRRYASKVFAKSISMLNDEGLARDATQDIFIKILLNLAKFGEQSSFSTWVYSITYNYCIDQIRKKKKGVLVFTDDPGRIRDEAEEELPDSVILEMKQQKLAQVLEDVPPGDKAILLMKYIDGLQIKEIATVLDKTESAIKMQIMRAKQKVESVYKEKFGDDPIGQ
ncbi:MAG: RNA polymerase sigma factor [Saprospiraceae bacterium]